MMIAAVVLLLTSTAMPERVEALTIDLTSRLVSITTGFAGTDVVLFGALDRPGEIAVVVRGPEMDMAVRRKERSAAGIWVNGESLVVRKVPSFYAVAVSGPQDLLADDAVLAENEIGLRFLEVDLADVDAGRERRDAVSAVLNSRKEMGLFVEDGAKIVFLGDRLFRYKLHLPVNVPIGKYDISVYLFNEGQLVGTQSHKFNVIKAGASAEIFNFATSQPFFYALLSIAVAVASGWIANTVFR